MDATEFDDVRLIIQAQSAWLYRINNREVWIPTDQVLNRDEWAGQTRGRLVIPRQLAQQLGLV